MTYQPASSGFTGYSTAAQGLSTPPRRRPPWWIFALVLVLIVAGTGTGLYVVVFDDRTATAAPTDDLGDVATLDPCGLVNPGIFTTRTTDARMFPTSFKSCTINLYDVGGDHYSPTTTITVTLEKHLIRGGSMNPDVGQVIGRHGALVTVKSPGFSPDSMCSEDLHQRNDAGVDVQVSNGYGVTVHTISPCAAADKVIADIVSTVEDRRLPRLSYPANSLGSVDLCATLSLDELDDALATPTAAALDGGHRCDWTTASSPNQDNADGVMLYTGLATPSVVQQHIHADGSGSYDTRIAGRATGVQPQPVCTFTTPVRTWASWPGRQAFGQPSTQSDAAIDEPTASAPALQEYAVLMFTGDISNDPKCTTATAIAAKVWSRLPAAS